MRVGAISVDFGEQWRRVAVICSAELLDLLRVARFLVSELVAGKTENGQAARVKRLMQRLETSVLRREPASACGVDDQQNLTLEPLQRNVLTGKRLCLEIVNASHGVLLKLVGN